MDTSFAASESHPSVYKVKFEKPSELRSVYENVILGKACVDDVSTALSQYVTANIEPVGWKAIWRHTARNGRDQRLSFDCDFEVEVVDVSHVKLVADVVVLRLLSPEQHELTTTQFDQKEALLKQIKVISVPLVELYVISENDSDEQFHYTAIVVEHIRFFYAVIWRPWDDLALNSNSNELFVNSKLQNRLDLYFDIKNKTLSQSTVNKINNLIQEARNIRYKIDNIYDTTDTKDKDSNEYIDEKEYFVALRLKMRLEDIEREMNLIEDRNTRMIATTVNTNTLFGDDSDDDQLSDHTSSSRIHLVAQNLTLSKANQTLAQLLNVESDQKSIIFHNTFEKALKSAKSCDKIYVLPGIYKCESFPWLECDIDLIGFGDSNDAIVLHSNDSIGDIFLNCNSNRITISNMTIMASTEMQCLIMVHCGHVTLNNCVLDAANCAKNTIIVLSKAKLEMESCEIKHIERGNGIVSRKDSIVINKSDHLSNISSEGQKIDSEDISVVCVSHDDGDQM